MLEVLGEKHLDTATIFKNLGLVYENQGNYEKALEYYQKALKIRADVLGASHPATIKAQQSIDELNQKLNSHE